MNRLQQQQRHQREQQLFPSRSAAPRELPASCDGRSSEYHAHLARCAGARLWRWLYERLLMRFKSGVYACWGSCDGPNTAWDADRERCARRRVVRWQMCGVDADHLMKRAAALWGAQLMAMAALVRDMRITWGGSKITTTPKKSKRIHYSKNMTYKNNNKDNKNKFLHTTQKWVWSKHWYYRMLLK